MKVWQMDKDVIVLAEFEHLGYVYQVVTWRTDGHGRLRLVRRLEPINDAYGPEWELVFIQ